LMLHCTAIHLRRETVKRSSVLNNYLLSRSTTGELIPGDPEHSADAIRSQQVIPLIEAVVRDLRDIAAKSGAPFG
jgi:hypothetical protein